MVTTGRHLTNGFVHVKGIEIPVSDSLELMASWVLKLNVNVKRCKEPTQYLARNVYALACRGQRLVTADYQQAILGNRSNMEVSLDISNVSEFLRRASALDEVGTGSSQVRAFRLDVFPSRSAGKRESGISRGNIIG